LDKAIEGLVLYAFNKGEVCTCPSRALIQESIYDKFMERCLARIAKITQGNPLDTTTMIGPQVSVQQLRRSSPTSRSARRRAPRSSSAASPRTWAASSRTATTSSPRSCKGHNKMRVFQEEIFGPVLAVTTFKDEAEALEIANDTLYGLGAGVWTRDGNLAYRMGRGIRPGECGRTATTCTRRAPPSAVTRSQVGRENHQMMLEHYSQTKNLLVSYSTKPLGFF
jgi:aldehyde dehydrogenase